MYISCFFHFHKKLTIRCIVVYLLYLRFTRININNTYRILNAFILFDLYPVNYIEQIYFQAGQLFVYPAGNLVLQGLASFSKAGFLFEKQPTDTIYPNVKRKQIKRNFSNNRRGPVYNGVLLDFDNIQKRRCLGKYRFVGLTRIKKKTQPNPLPYIYVSLVT